MKKAHLMVSRLRRRSSLGKYLYLNLKAIPKQELTAELWFNTMRNAGISLVSGRDYPVLTKRIRHRERWYRNMGLEKLGPR